MEEESIPAAHAHGIPLPDHPAFILSTMVLAPTEHFAVDTELDLRSCCALLEEAFGTARFRFDAENESVWGEAEAPGELLLNVAKPNPGKLQEWDETAPPGCTIGIGVTGCEEAEIAALARGWRTPSAPLSIITGPGWDRAGTSRARRCSGPSR